MTALVAGTITLFDAGFFMTAPVVFPAMSIGPPPVTTTCVMGALSMTVTGLADGFTNTLPFWKSRS
jgi:hypothetical protein